MCLLSLICATLIQPFSSPMFTYSTDDWTEGYAAQPNGFDQTLHMAASSGSRVSFNLAGTYLIPGVLWGCEIWVHFAYAQLHPSPYLFPLSIIVPPSYRSTPQTQFQLARHVQPRHLPIFPFHSIRFLWVYIRSFGT